MVSALWNSKPSDVDGQENISVSMYRRLLLNDVIGVFDIVGEVPNTWDMQYFWTNLLLQGNLCITDTSLGVLPLITGLSGINVFNRPTTCVVANPILGSFERQIGNNCAHVYIMPDYSGLDDLIRIYSYLLGNCDGSIAVNLMNTRVSFIAECEDKAQARSMEVMYDQISSGRPAVFVKKNMGANFQYLNPKQSYIADDIVQLKRNLRNEFLSMIGIGNLNMEKKERLTSNEIEYGNEEAVYSIQNMLDNINHGLDVANRLFNLNLKCKRRILDDNGQKVGDSEDGSDNVE